MDAQVTPSSSSSPPPRGVPGAKFLRAVGRAPAPLKDVPAHGNRTPHPHPLVVTLVTAFYDPLIRSPRAVEAHTSRDAVEPPADAAVRRMARSTTSDAPAAFDPELLRGVIDDLQKQVPDLRHAGPKLRGIVKRVVAADGSYFSTFADVTRALHPTRSNGRTQGQVRLNLRMSAADWVPRVVGVGGGDEARDGSEPDAAARDLLEGVLYVADRNSVAGQSPVPAPIDFDFLKALPAKNNGAALRVRGNAPAYEVLESRPLDLEGVAAGVTADHLVRLTGRGAPAGTFRIVEVRHAPKPAELVRLLTNPTDAGTVPAHVIAAAYRQRRQVELFFRRPKAWCNFDHLPSTTRPGVTTQFYVIVIATPLMYIHPGRRVSKYTLIAPRYIASGQATAEKTREFPARRDRERDQERARRARKAAAAKNA